jgi:hypothetical protein
MSDSNSDYTPWYWYWWYDWQGGKGNPPQKPPKLTDKAPRCEKRKRAVVDPNESPPTPNNATPPQRFTQREYKQVAPNKWEAIPEADKDFWVWCENKKCPGDGCNLYTTLVSLPNGNRKTDFKCRCMTAVPKSRTKPKTKASNKRSAPLPKNKVHSPPESGTPKK